MSRDELIKLVEKICNIEGTEEEMEEILHTFLSNVPDPDASKYIYSKEYENLSPEEVVDKALSYKPFQL